MVGYDARSRLELTDRTHRHHQDAKAEEEEDGPQNRGHHEYANYHIDVDYRLRAET